MNWLNINKGNYDFSGYSDMAIGLGRICGFHYSENEKKILFLFVYDIEL